jgi:hypothetical protein
MQRPRITNRVAEGLAYAVSHLEGISVDMGGDDYSPEMRADMGRAIKFIEETIRWQRARAARMSGLKP